MAEDNDDIRSVTGTISEVEGDIEELASTVRMELGAGPSRQNLEPCTTPIVATRAVRTTGSYQEPRRTTHKPGKKRTVSRPGEKEVNKPRIH